MQSYQKLEYLFIQYAHLQHAKSILSWDEATMMPAGGGEIRAQSIATLTDLQQQLLTNPSHLALINEAKTSPHLNDWQQRNLKLMEKQIRIQTAIPSDLLIAMTNHSIRTEQAWRKLRAENNWADFKPLLAKTIDYSREYANALADLLKLNPYDALLDLYSPDLTQAIIDPIFDTLKQELPLLLITAEQKQLGRKVKLPIGPFAVTDQKSICMNLMRAIGFDFNHGRLDTSHHPFCGGDPDDIRMTTRYNEDDFIQSLLGTCHETGHAMYELNLPLDWKRQPVGQALGMSLHESQSLLIEMHACRSVEFIRFLSPLLIEKWGIQDAFQPDNLYSLFTQVHRGLIRVDADEVTYPFHVILRYEIEKNLIDGELSVDDLPAVWNEKMISYLGRSTEGDYKNGVMQDVHWPSGAFGYFPAYNFGSLLASQFFYHAKKANPDIPTELEKGDFKSLNSWLNKHIRSKGSLLTTNDLVRNATGEPINPCYFLNHIKNRYGE
jgi:carboxypeptidase Taq